MSEFLRRATLYTMFDRALAPYTRFFGAAAMTNSVLHELLSPGFLYLTVARNAHRFLYELGSHLESINTESACRMQCGTSAGHDLDIAMVKHEQTAVQRQLERLRIADQAIYSLTISGLDRILSPAGWLGSLGKFFPSAVQYRCVLSGVRNQLGHPIRFAEQADRECIGRSLINAIRGGHS